MAAPSSYPSYAYNSTQQLAVIVGTVAAFTALPSPGTWTTTPFPGLAAIPTDPGLTDTDVRLQQILVETRLNNNLLAIVGSITDDLVAWRQDIVANDSGLTT